MTRDTVVFMFAAMKKIHFLSTIVLALLASSNFVFAAEPSVEAIPAAGYTDATATPKGALIMIPTSFDNSENLNHDAEFTFQIANEKKHLVVGTGWGFQRQHANGIEEVLYMNFDGKGQLTVTGNGFVPIFLPTGCNLSAAGVTSGVPAYSKFRTVKFDPGHWVNACNLTF